MLELHFINVADGDATLVEERHGQYVYRLLVDAGRERPTAAPGSMCCTAAQYLRQKGVTHLDAVVITHLHVDHFGGLREIMEDVTVGALYAGFISSEPPALDRSKLADIKSVRGLADCLERWAEDCEHLRAMGCRMYNMTQTDKVAFTPWLTGRIIGPGRPVSLLQQLAYSAMLSGEQLLPEQQYWASKSRNPCSLRVRLLYAAREVELSGDCYGAGWEDGAVPCDIWKVPHHADAKALTEALVRRLRPFHAVVSCGAEYNPKKDRPSRTAVELLERQGAQVWFTDSFAAPWHAPQYWRSVDLIIKEDGDILPPGRQT